MVHVLLRPSALGSNVRYKNCCHTALKQSRCTCTTAYPRCAGHNGQFFFVCHKSCAHGFKTERVHLHHCIPLRWGTQWIFFLIPQIRLSHRVNKAGAPAPPHTPDVRDTMVNFLFDPKKTDNFVPHMGGMQWCRCTRPVLNLCDNLICGFGKIDHQKMDDCAPDLRGMQWCRCTRPVLKLCPHGIKHFVLHIEGCGGAGAPALSPYKKVNQTTKRA